MPEIILHSMEQYPMVLRRVMQYGEKRAPRGQSTIDLGFTTLILLNQRGGMPLGMGRKLNPAIGAVEAVQLIAGTAATDLVLRIAPQFAQYADTHESDGHDPFFWGAYGERIKMQAFVQIRKMIADPETRQAVITLWDPWLDNVVGKKDYPCTIALQFSMRDGSLDMNVIMRSNDAWLGLPYDVFQFTQLQASMSKAMSVQPGIYRHTALSLHLYERDVAAARSLVDKYFVYPGEMHSGYRNTWQPDGIGRIGDKFGDIMDRATMLILNKPVHEETKSEVWYRDQLHGSGATA